MKTIKKFAALSALLAVSGCSDLNVPNFNDVSVQDLTTNPTRAGIAAVAQGLLSGQRGLSSAYVIETGGWGREVYNLRPEEPRTITAVLITPLDGRNRFWSGPYAQVRNIGLLLDAVDVSEDLTDAEKEAVRGFAKTLWAEAFFNVIQGVGDFGAPIDILREDPSELAPVVSESEFYTRVFQLFDEAQTHLENGGSAFPFTMTPGMAGFDTPSTFLLVNRALKVRTLKYQSQWNDVLATLPETLIDETAALTLGAYHSYSTNSGDATNALCCTVALYAHPRIRGDAQLQADGSLDQRALDKTCSVAEFKLLGISATERYCNFTGFATLSDPQSWIRNEELILIRAEANLASGNSDLALQDVNLIRTTSGNLPAIDVADWNAMSADDQLTELLYNKFMSLVLEGGFTYRDHRQYNRLDRLPRATDADTGDDLGHVVFLRYPYPTNECLARDITTDVACQIIAGT